MEQLQVESIYKKKIKPLRIFGFINAIAALGIIVFFFGAGFVRCTSGTFVKSVSVTVLPLPLNEMEAIKDQEKREYYRKNLFEEYARKVKVNNTKDFHRIYLKVRNLPVYRTNLRYRNKGVPRYVEIAFEVYSKDKDYLFTFYADNFWHQRGYDDGYWHQWNLKEKINVKFPYDGEYYFVAAIGKNNYSRIMYNAVKNYSKGQITVSIYEGIKPFSFFPFLIAVIIFTVAAIILFKIKSGAIPKRRMVHVESGIDFENNHYIAKLPDKISKKPFYVSGYIKQKNNKKIAEFILTQDNVNTYLEAEEEIEYTDNGKKSNYYFYYYKMLPESEFQEIPRKDASQGKNYIKYRQERLYFKKPPTLKTFKHAYSNGLSEDVKKSVLNLGNALQTQYLSFEWLDDASNFDVSFGYEIKDAKIWEVEKDEGNN